MNKQEPTHSTVILKQLFDSLMRKSKSEIKKTNVISTPFYRSQSPVFNRDLRDKMMLKWLTK